MHYQSEMAPKPSANAIDYLTQLIRQVLPPGSFVGIYSETSRGLEYRATWGLRLDPNGRLSASRTVNIIISHEALEAYSCAGARDRQAANGRLRRLLLQNFQTRRSESGHVTEQWDIDWEFLSGADEVVRAR